MFFSKIILIFFGYEIVYLQKEFLNLKFFYYFHIKCGKNEPTLGAQDTPTTHFYKFSFAVLLSHGVLQVLFLNPVKKFACGKPKIGCAIHNSSSHVLLPDGVRRTHPYVPHVMDSGRFIPWWGSVWRGEGVRGAKGDVRELLLWIWTENKHDFYVKGG